jgi:hypothetical protein
MRGGRRDVLPSDLRVNEAVATEIAAAHRDAPRTGGPLARAAYAQLIRESDRLFRFITEPGRRDRVRIAFTTCSTPYDSAAELITSVRRDRVLEVTTAAKERGRVHPLMGCELGGPYDRFRAVHDVLGHACLVVGFDRHGEFATWRFQEQWHSPLARRALATELHGEHSVRWTTGELAEHKAVLLDERTLRSARTGRPPLRHLITMPGSRD